MVDPVTEAESHGATARWRGETVSLTRVYSEPTSAFRDAAPDRREFLLECGDGVVRKINGYRGSAGDLEHRALPVVDARLLVNSVGFPKEGARLLDPFAGAGGVAIAAREAGWKTSTSDVDPRLRYGLDELADDHRVADARKLPWADSTFDAIASEPPYHPSASDAVVESLTEIARVLAPNGRAALLVAAGQRDQVADAASRSGLSLVTQADVSRKNMPVTLLVFGVQGT